MIEDDCYFLGVHMRLSTRCKILFTLGLFANYFSLKSISLSLKSHMNVLCALKLTELWNTSLLFDLNYKYLYQGMCSKQGPTLRELRLHFPSRTFRQGTELKYKQTTVLDKSGHGCGRFNEIKANRITTHRYM